MPANDYSNESTESLRARLDRLMIERQYLKIGKRSDRKSRTIGCLTFTIADIRGELDEREAMEPTFVVGDSVSWNSCLDDQPRFTGEIIFNGYSTFLIRRPDGGTATVEKTQCRRASLDEIDAFRTYLANGCKV